MLLNKKITKDLQLLKWRRYLESVNDVSNLARVAKGQIVTLQKFCQEHSQFWETDARSDKSYSVTQFVKKHGVCVTWTSYRRRPSGGQDTDLEGWALMIQKSSLSDFDDPKVFFNGLWMIQKSSLMDFDDQKVFFDWLWWLKSLLWWTLVIKKSSLTDFDDPKVFFDGLWWSKSLLWKTWKTTVQISNF